MADTSSSGLLRRGLQPGDRRLSPLCGYREFRLFFFLPSFAKTEKSSSVVVSPTVAEPEARSRNNRRMIFPLRVFGKRVGEADFIGLCKAADGLCRHGPSIRP